MFVLSFVVSSAADRFRSSIKSLSISGQQLDSDGALVLSDSLLTSNDFSRLFPSDGSTLVEGLQLILPFASSAWKKLLHDQLPKSIRYAQITDASGDIDEENRFGEIFYQKLCSILQDDTVNFHIHTKLIPRDSSGTSEEIRLEWRVTKFVNLSVLLVAFDEPNLYVLYGQQGEASLFGVRGFVPSGQWWFQVNS